MRVTVIPAEVTSVEDKILGNFSLKQTGLVAFAVLGTVVLAGSMDGLSTASNMSIIIALWTVCLGLALRIKGVTVMDHAVILLKYMLRPKYHVYDRRDVTGRALPRLTAQETTAVSVTADEIVEKAVTNLDVIGLEQMYADPNAQIVYKTDRKGRLYAHITQVSSKA